jgi:hypothetical protein
MTMKYNTKKGTIARLSICVAFVLLLAFFASVAPAGASKTSCYTTCGKCSVDKNPSDWDDQERCVAICKIQGVIVYAGYERTCDIYYKHQTCTPRSICTDNGNCETGKNKVVLCKGEVKKCPRWTFTGLYWGCPTCDCEEDS